MALSKKTIDELKPKDKVYMVSDVEGLYLEVRPTGTKTWKYRAMKDGKQVKITLGHYPAIPLSEARSKSIENQTKLERGESLVQEKENKGMIFSELAEKFMAFQENKSPTYIKSLNIRLDKYILPAVGKLELPKITTKMIVDLYEQIIADTNPSGGKKYETASRVKQVIGQIMRYGRAIGETQNDPTAGLMLQNPNKENHFASAKTDTEIKKLINLIYNYDFPIVRGALLFNSLTFTRPGETRQAKWDEIEFDRKIWRIPAIKMKSRREHLVPLSSQTLLVLEELKPFTCNQEWIFPSTRNGRPMSDGTAIAGLRRLGYQKGEITAHGFRHTASTRLNESALFSSDAIERQLAHHDKTVRGIYNSAEYWPERVKVMQWWGDFLWGLLDIKLLVHPV